MATTFSELVDEVRHPTPEEQDELRRILEQTRIDARRTEIARHARDSMEEEKPAAWSSQATRLHCSQSFKAHD